MDFSNLARLLAISNKKNPNSMSLGLDLGSVSLFFQVPIYSNSSFGRFAFDCQRQTFFYINGATICLYSS